MFNNQKIAHEQSSSSLLWVIIGVISIVLLLMNVVGLHYHLGDYVLLSISLLLLARFSWSLILRKTVSVDLLMGVAGIVTWYIHAILEGFLIFTLYSLSEIIEVRAEKYAEKKLTVLREILPKQISIVGNGEISYKKLEDVVEGDIILVKPGEVVPADGVIIDGESTFDTSYVTGESEPVLLGVGDRVMSGYINRDRMVKVRVLKKPRESLLQLLVREAMKSLEKKSRLQKFIERFSQPYTFLVLGIFGLSTLVLTPYRALAILLAGCPSAFIISSSTSTAITIALLARRSTIVRGGRTLEDSSKVRAIIFDKTGTITLGEMKIVNIIPFNGYDERIVLEYAGGAAKASEHPVAKALSKHSKLAPSYAAEYPGKGVEAVIDGEKVLIGSKSFLEENGVEIQEQTCGSGIREVHVAINNVYAGLICLEEDLSEEAKQTIQSLKEKGLHVIIASGDRVERVRHVAAYLGVDEYYGELAPEDKKNLVVEARRKYGKVAFVGDGINDLEALAEADVGIAIGSLRVVSNIGDVVLLKGITTLPVLFHYAYRYVKSIYSSISLALTVKLTAMILGVLGFIPLWIVVGIGDDGATLVALGVIAYIISRT